MTEELESEGDESEKQRKSFMERKDVWESDDENSDDDDEKAGKGVKWGEDVVQIDRPDNIKKMGTGMIGSQSGQKNMVGAQMGQTKIGFGHD